jgi:hypothetical protein
MSLNFSNVFNMVILFTMALVNESVDYKKKTG